MTFANLTRPGSLALLLSCVTIAPGLYSGPARAAEAGWRQYEVPASAANPDPIPVALYYPARAPEHEMAMGPFTVHLAPMAPPEDRVKGLIVVSHGTGGSELSLDSLAEALARDGYLAAALRHPGDNYLDHSLWQKPPEAYFIERPRQASRVIDALLADPEWKDRIAKDAKGPLVGAVGHSAGGYTVVALAGGKVDLSLMGAHCAKDGAEDPITCNMRHDFQSAQAPMPLDSTADARVRAIVALAPVGAMFTQQSLKAINEPTLIYAAEKDRWLPPRFHAARIARNVPGAILRVVPNAWHFAFMDKVGIPTPTLDGDANADPSGFDRAAFLKRLDEEVPAFFDQALAGGRDGQ
jgi:predicted dienelactone hydrolase